MPRRISQTRNSQGTERHACVEALRLSGNIQGAAQLLGVTFQEMKRQIMKFRVQWPLRTSENAVTHRKTEADRRSQTG